MKALKQAIKSVPAALEKNERFKRVALLVGGNHSKKDCYDKYRELKAEAKLRQNTSRKASEVSAGSGTSRGHRLTRPGYDDDRPSPCGPAIGKFDSPDRDSIPHPVSVEQQDDLLESTSITAGSVAASAGSDILSRRDSAFSSWSSNTAEYFGQQQQEQKQQRQHRRRSTTSSTLSSVMSDLLGDATGDGPAGTVTATRHGGETYDTPLGAAYKQAELMEVEEVDVEDCCLDDELLTEEHRSMVGVAQARVRGQAGRESPRKNVGGRVGVGGGGDTERLEVSTVTEAEANGVRELIFGKASKSFNDAWKEQGFYFCGIDGLRYGLVQAEGGPCGVLAVVQAFLLEVNLADASQSPRVQRADYSLPRFVERFLIVGAGTSAPSGPADALRGPYRVEKCASLKIVATRLCRVGMCRSFSVNTDINYNTYFSMEAIHSSVLRHTSIKNAGYDLQR